MRCASGGSDCSGSKGWWERQLLRTLAMTQLVAVADMHSAWIRVSSEYLPELPLQHGILNVDERPAQASAMRTRWLFRT